MATALAKFYKAASGGTLYIGRTAPPPVPDVFDSVAFTLGVDSTSYLLGWPAAANAVSYSYSVDGGTTWTPRGTAQWAMVTGRTPSSVDVVIVRAYGSTGLSSDMSTVVGLAAPGAPTTVFSVIGTGTNPFTGGACDYSNPHAWTTAGTVINGGNASLSATNKRLIGLCLKQEFLNTPTVFGDGTAAGLGNNLMTTSATCYRELSAFPGHSFCDHVGRATNPLRYNAAVGAGMKYASSTANPIIDLREGYSRCSRLQLCSVGNGFTTWGGWGIHTSVNAPAKCYADRMLVESGTDQYVFSFNYADHVITNCIAVQMRPFGQPTPETIVEQHNGSKHLHCTIIALGQTPDESTTARISTTLFENCAVFGATYLYKVYSAASSDHGTSPPTYVGSMTDSQKAKNLADQETGLPSGVTYCSLSDAGFESTTFGTGNYDLRLKSTSALRNASPYNSTCPHDIHYRRRPTSGGCSAGAVQYH